MGKKQKNGQGSGPLKGAAGFEQFYSSLYGERWEKLKEAFANPNDSVEFMVPCAQKPYYLDSASIFAALCLPLDNATDILDLCAAPGGKTLVLASRMNDDAVLSSNERSPQRKHRLSVWCTRQSECFDAILLDAPCSSERHVIADPKYLDQWSPSRIKTVTMEQWALLSSAYRLLRKGGYLLYSTCALAPQENDEMMERLIKKFQKEGSDSFEFVEPAPQPSQISKCADFVLSEYEKTKYGYQILPDISNGAGPIYFSLIKKT